MEDLTPLVAKTFDIVKNILLSLCHDPTNTGQ